MSTESIKDTISRQFTEASEIFDLEIQSHQLMCRIYDRFSGPEEAHHNCLGCNFDDLTEQISKYLQLTSQNTVEFRLNHQFSIYALLFNSCWERITDVFNIIGLPEGYQCRHFSPLIRVRRWANFFKHPKTFGWLVHHPIYTIDKSDHFTELISERYKYKFIDEEFLKTYYSHDSNKNMGKLRGEFDGFERNMVVILPDISELTYDICRCLSRFVEIITYNPVFTDILDDKSTIKNYFIDDAATNET